jgi:hypothetical protein
MVDENSAGQAHDNMHDAVHEEGADDEHDKHTELQISEVSHIA